MMASLILALLLSSAVGYLLGQWLPPIFEEDDPDGW
jgi:hypothetical protein